MNLIACKGALKWQAVNKFDSKVNFMTTEESFQLYKSTLQENF